MTSVLLPLYNHRLCVIIVTNITLTIPPVPGGAYVRLPDFVINDPVGNRVTRFTLQISDQLNTWLTEQARLNHRSKNKQIEWLLDMARRMPINNKVNITMAGQVPPLPADIEKWLKDQGVSK